MDINELQRILKEVEQRQWIKRWYERIISKHLFRYETLRAFFQTYVSSKNALMIRYLNIFRNLDSSPALTSDDSKDVKNVPGKRDIWYPFARIPDVRYFSIALQNFDQLYALFGIKKRFKPILRFQKYNNGAANRYMEHQLIRLEKALKAKDIRLFWRIAIWCFRRSITFFLSQLRLSQPNWHREMPLWKVVKLYKSFRKLANEMADDLDFRRVYIPKSNGKLRPLGVPEPHWIIYESLLNKFLLKFTGRTMNPRQHAYLPGRGTLTAWKQMFEEVIPSRDIYEFDLQGFFDRVSLSDVDEVLSLKGVPKYVRELLFSLNTRVPRNIGDIESTDPLSTIKRYRSYGKGQFYEGKFIGVPQGGSLSPLLAILTLEYQIFTEFPKNIIMYADDGIIYGDFTKFTKRQINYMSKGIVSATVQFNKSKCQAVKSKGVWLEDLKFLGLRYSGISNLLRGDTRNGSCLIFTKQDLISWLKVRQDNKETWGKDKKKVKDSWQELVRSCAYGLIQSRLYQGKWDLDDFEQNFQLVYCKGSWCYYRKHMIKSKGLTVFNSTSFALRSLFFILKRKRPPNALPIPQRRQGLVAVHKMLDFFYKRHLRWGFRHNDDSMM